MEHGGKFIRRRPVEDGIKESPSPLDLPTEGRPKLG